MVMVTRHQFGLEASKCFSHKVPFYDVTKKMTSPFAFKSQRKGFTGGSVDLISHLQF